MSIEVIVLENIKALTHHLTLYTPKSCTNHAVFQYFMSDKRKRDSATTAAHEKKTLD